MDANYIDCDSSKPQRQLYGYSIAAKRYALYEKTGKSSSRVSQSLIPRPTELVFSIHHTTPQRSGIKMFHSGFISFGITSFAVHWKCRRDHHRGSTFPK